MDFNKFKFLYLGYGVKIFKIFLKLRNKFTLLWR